MNNSVTPETIISNTATVSSANPDPNPDNNSSTATVVVKSLPPAPQGNGRIAFVSDRNFSNSTEPTGFYTINPDGMGESLFSGIEPFGSGPAWSPDGTKLAYGKRNHAGTYSDEIRIANPDGTGSFSVAGNVFNNNTRIAWSPSGAKLAFIGTGGFIYIVNSDGTGLARVPNSPSFINDVSWSPDGSRFAYANGDIFVMNLDGSGQVNLTQGALTIRGEGAGGVLPRWAPDGSRLVFGGVSNNYRNLFFINPDGTGLAAVPNVDYGAQPAWSPDGTKLTFMSLNSIYVANLNGTGMTPVTSNGFYNSHPDWQPLANPIDQASFFVRQHYLDFLSREPDQGGWNYWTAEITRCGIDPLCTHRRRIGVSGSFFVEQEFQETGYVVYRFHRASFGTWLGAPNRANLTFSRFLTDRSQLVGGAGLAQSTITFANNFVQLTEFKTAYPDAMTPTEFVTKLFDTAGLTGPANTALRQAAIDGLTGSTKTRAQVLRELIEINEFKVREYNPAFVLMQYFGYLRRNPEQEGYDFWLNVLDNREPNNFQGMICSFITSAEYQHRFGSTVTRTNADCGQ